MFKALGFRPYDCFPEKKRNLVQGAIEVAREDRSRTNEQKAKIIADQLGVKERDVLGVLNFDFLGKDFMK